MRAPRPADLDATQFPAQCGGAAFLRVTDDLHGAGLGFTAKLLAFVLMMAAERGQILVEGRARAPRWCTTAPATLQCYYQPWTHCAITNASRVEHLRLRDFHASGMWFGWSGATTPRQQADAMRILFRVRPHVSKVVDAVRDCTGTESSYWTVHVRDSPEKRRERPRDAFPPPAAYFDRLPSKVRALVLQTAHPVALGEMVALCAQRGLRCCFTNYTRHVHDVWGGRDAAWTDESGLTGAVNGELGRRGRGVVSHSKSMWNWFLTVGTHQPLYTV